MGVSIYLQAVKRPTLASPEHLAHAGCLQGYRDGVYESAPPPIRTEHIATPTLVG